MMRICSIASGSSGNCVYVGSESAHILIDAGCSKKKITEGLNGLGLTLDDVDALFITHEHTDHTAGIKTILKHHDIPLYATAGTLSALGLGDGIAEENTEYGETDAPNENAVRTDASEDAPPQISRVKSDERYTVGDLSIMPFHISHDALEPVCYRVRAGERAFVIATDMGCFDDYTAACVRGADVVMMEANHDVRMLQTGPYPYSLKQRILSDKGHLSNDAAGALLTKTLHDKLQTIMLGHLSERNNLPELAYETVRLEIEMSDNDYRASDFRLLVADRRAASPVVTV